MKLRTPLILLAILLLLGGIATWDDWRTEKKQKQKESEKRLTELEQADITKVIYRDTNSNSKSKDTGETEQEAEQEGNKKPEQIVLEKIEGFWRIVQPIEVKADGKAVEDFLQTVLDYSYEQIVAEGEGIDLVQFGLDKPMRAIVLTSGKKSEAEQEAEDTSTSSYALYLGNKSPVGYSSYFRVGEAKDKIYLGSQYALTSTKKSLFAFRDKSLVEIDGEAVKRVTFWHKEHNVAYVVERQDGKFQLLKPTMFKTSQQKVNEYIDEFNQVRVEKFIDAPDAGLQQKFATASSVVMTAVFEFSTGESKQLAFVRDRGDLLVSFDASRVVFKLPAAFEEKLRDLSENFRDHSIFNFTTHDIEEIDIDGDAYRLVEKDWYKASEVSSDGKLLNKEATANDTVGLLLDSLENAEALEFVERSKESDIVSKTLERRLTLTLRKDKATNEAGSEKTDSDKSKLEVSFWTHATDKEKYYLKHNDSEQMYVVAKSILGALTEETTSILTE